MGTIIFLRGTMLYTLYLASDSAARKELLAAAGIPFTLIRHQADETQVDLTLPLEQIVTHLAVLKMEHVLVPSGRVEGQTVFVITADTLTTKGLEGQQQILGKPKDRDDARRMIKVSRDGSITGTGFCIQKRQWQNNQWVVVDQRTGYDETWIMIDIPDDFIDYYLDRIPFLTVSGAIRVQGICEQFTKEMRGSLSAIMGLPMYKVREVLCAMNFYK